MSVKGFWCDVQVTTVRCTWSDGGFSRCALWLSCALAGDRAFGEWPLPDHASDTTESFLADCFCIQLQDPFRGGDNIIVMADAYEPPRDKDGKHVDMKPIPTNSRHACAEAMKKAAKEEPWFGIEQVG